MPAARSKSPPRAQLTFRVGVVGHRPDRLPKEQDKLDALQAMIRHVLATVQTEVLAFAKAEAPASTPLYAPDPPALRAASPLAEGSDRMFGEVAIALGYEVLCPMPFYQEDYEHDFVSPHAMAPDALDKFHELLERAREGAGLVTYELNGQRSAAGDAYGMAGRVVLNQSDLLLVVWDRGKPKGGGGTVQTLHEAAQFRVPMLWIDPFDPKEWRLLLTENDIGRVERDEPPETTGRYGHELETQIKEILAAELGPPRARPDQNQVTQLSATEYFSEKKPRWNFWIVWKIFRDLLANGRPSRPRIEVADFETQIKAEWPILADNEPKSDNFAAASSQQASSASSDMDDWVNCRLRPHYAWADKLADWYADHYRSAYILVYLLSAIGVLISLLGHRAWWSGSLEFLCVGTIVWVVISGSKWHWHERWMEYRLLAELIRQIRIKIPLGGGRPLPRTPIHLGIYEDLTQTWMYWHMRAVARATGIPSARIVPQYLLDCLSYVDELVRSQVRFHERTMARSKTIAEELHTLASNLFLVSFCFIIIRLVSQSTEHLSPGLGYYVPFVLSAVVLVTALALRSGRVFLFVTAFLAGLVLALTVFSFDSVGDLFLVLAVLPAFGAAFTGIANQGEFARLEKRSIAMAGAFQKFEAQIEQLQSKIKKEAPGTAVLTNVINLATDITQVMVDEVSDWRVVVAEQPMRW